jgi:copper chaperone
MANTYVFKVEMTCEGCSGAVKRILERNQDKVSDFKIDLEGKTVTVTSALSKDEVEVILKKCGKEVTFLN